MFLCNDAQFDSLLRCHIHHHLIEAVDRRIIFPIDVSIDVVRIVGNSVRLLFLLVHVESSREIECQRLLDCCGLFLFPRLGFRCFLCLLLGLFLFRDLLKLHPVIFPEVEQ